MIGEKSMEKLFTGIHSAIFSVYDENMDVKKDTVAKWWIINLAQV